MTAAITGQVILSDCSEPLPCGCFQVDIKVCYKILQMWCPLPFVYPHAYISVPLSHGPSGHLSFHTEWMAKCATHSSVHWEDFIFTLIVRATPECVCYPFSVCSHISSNPFVNQTWDFPLFQLVT